MKTRHGTGVGLVGLLVSTIAFAEAPVASTATSETAVVASSADNAAIEEIVVTARRPVPRPTFEVAVTADPLDLMSETPIRAPELDELVIEPEFHLHL